MRERNSGDFSPINPDEAIQFATHQVALDAGIEKFRTLVDIDVKINEASGEYSVHDRKIILGVVVGIIGTIGFLTSVTGIYRQDIDSTTILAWAGALFVSVGFAASEWTKSTTAAKNLRLLYNARRSLLTHQDPGE